MISGPGWHTGPQVRAVLCPQPWELHGLASTLVTTQFQRLPSSMGPADCVPMGLCLSHGHAGPRPALRCPVYQCPTLRGSEGMRSEPGPRTQWDPGSAPKSLCCWINAFPAWLCFYQDTNVAGVCLPQDLPQGCREKMLQAIPNSVFCTKGGPDSHPYHPCSIGSYALETAEAASAAVSHTMSGGPPSGIPHPLLSMSSARKTTWTKWVPLELKSMEIKTHMRKEHMPPLTS